MRNEFLLALSIKENGDWNNVVSDLKNKVRVSKEEINLCYSKLNGEVIMIGDDTYPEHFKSIAYPPLCIYSKGNVSLLKNNCKLAVVGSRNISKYGEYITKKLISEFLDLMPNATIVSGLANGVDSIAMREAMKKNADVIGVSGAGIDVIYPTKSNDIYEYCNGRNGLLLSEYPLNVEPMSEHFPMRNRLITGLCDYLLVIEGDEKSGTSISVGYALEQGKTVMAVPRNIDSTKKLTNKLIKDGACPILSAQDICEYMNS